MKQQSHIERLYLSVKDVVEQRKSTLEQQHWLQQLHQDVEELEKWISQRELVAASTELGQDLEHVTVSLPLGLRVGPLMYRGPQPAGHGQRKALCPAASLAGPQSQTWEQG